MSAYFLVVYLFSKIVFIPAATFLSLCSVIIRAQLVIAICHGSYVNMLGSFVATLNNNLWHVLNFAPITCSFSSWVKGFNGFFASRRFVARSLA